MRLYVNGDRVTTFSSATYPAQNTDFAVNNTQIHEIGRYVWGQDLYLSAMLADVYLIDGQALTPTSFGETDATTGVWNPKAYTGSYGTNGFHLEFADNSAATATTLGKDTSGNGNNWTPNNLSIITGGPTSVASASGALPILNTTDTYGDTVGSGVRSDAFAANIACAIPLGTASGLNTADQSPTGRVSATKTVTNSSGTNNTSISQFYGGSLYINGASGSRLYVDGFTSFASNYSTNFTIECWFYPVAITNNNNVFVFHNDRANVAGTFRVYWNGSGFAGTGLTGTSTGASANRWYHIAYVRSGSTNTLYVNGVATLSGTGSATTAAAYAYLILGERIVSDSNNFRGQAYYSDLRAYETAKYTSSFNPPSTTQNATVGAGCDSLVDVPTNGATSSGGDAGGTTTGNYCTWNALAVGSASDLAPSNGNLDATGFSVAGNRNKSITGTIGVMSGKWYWEVAVTSVTSTPACVIGISSKSSPNELGDFPGANSFGWSYYAANGTKNNGTQLSYGASYTAGDVIGVALDVDNGTLTFYKNNTSQGTAYTGLTTGPYYPAIGHGGSVQAFVTSANFGQRPFAYTAPSGFKALNTANLPAPLVTKPNTVMDVLAYSGSGSSRTFTGFGFGPDLVWIKQRSGANNHRLYDAVRGTTKALYSNLTNSEGTDSTGLTSFTSDGFTLGDGDVVWNASGQTYVAWAFDAGSSTVTNTSGSISSQVRANATAGFSVVTYTGTGTTGTVGHGLGVVPSMMIVKRRDAAANWYVYHSAIGNTGALGLNLTNATITSANFWNNTSPTSTVLTVSAGSAEMNTNGGTYVVYAFAPVSGYSSFGSITSNGTSDNAFAYLGFRPRFLLYKNASATGNWGMYDSSRDPENVCDNLLLASSSNAEFTSVEFDFLSNGIKLRYPYTNGNQIVFAAFAESPFNYSRAR